MCIAIGILVFVAIIAMFACKPSKKSNAGTPEAGSVAQTKVVVAQQPESNVQRVIYLSVICQ